MLTKSEALGRAKMIWGDKPFELRPIYVTADNIEWFVDEPVPNPHYRGRDSLAEGVPIPPICIRVHRLDGNGATQCHPDCAKREYRRQDNIQDDFVFGLRVMKQRVRVLIDEGLAVNSRLTVLLRRITEWEELEDAHPAEAEELLMDVKQCLESIVKGRPS